MARRGLLNLPHEQLVCQNAARASVPAMLAFTAAYPGLVLLSLQLAKGRWQQHYSYFLEITPCLSAFIRAS